MDGACNEQRRSRFSYTQSFFSIHEGTSEPLVNDGGVHCPGTIVP